MTYDGIVCTGPSSAFPVASDGQVTPFGLKEAIFFTRT